MTNNPKILIVDDESFYINVLVDLLGDEYWLVVAKDGKNALRLAGAEPRPDLILLDVIMPEMDGYEVCRRLKGARETRDIPTIFLTVKSEISDELKGFELGAEDYITKPMSPPVVKSRVRTHLALARARRELESRNRVLEEMVAERTREILHTQDVAIYCMALLAENDDAETGKHILRTQHYVRLLAEKLRDHPDYADYLGGDGIIEQLVKCSALHDVGKVGVPKRILMKPGPLDTEEWNQMKPHAEYGSRTIRKAEDDLGNSPVLELAREIAHTHHEKWDGSGYPRGLKGQEIPISGRLMALADVYDALISRRVYKSPIPHAEARNMILAESGRHFDPAMVEAFSELHMEFRRVAEEFSESRDG